MMEVVKHVEEQGRSQRERLYEEPFWSGKIAKKRVPEAEPSVYQDLYAVSVYMHWSCQYIGVKCHIL
jgi:hypothetical protein